MSIIENKIEIHNNIFKKLYPTYMFNKVEDIPLDLIKKDNIKVVLLDMDNTLINRESNSYTRELKEWVKMMLSNDIKLFIFSNSMNSKLVIKIANELKIGYFFKAAKPFLKGFNNVYNTINIDKKNILIIGDQLFTDILGGNRFGIKTLLVKPISSKEIFITKIKRPLENAIIKHYIVRKGVKK